MAAGAPQPAHGPQTRHKDTVGPRSNGFGFAARLCLCAFVSLCFLPNLSLGGQPTMKRYLPVFAVAAALVFALTAYGHHSIAATYDGNKEIKLTGKIVEFDFRNPHAFVHI